MIFDTFKFFSVVCGLAAVLTGLTTYYDSQDLRNAQVLHKKGIPTSHSYPPQPDHLLAQHEQAVDMAMQWFQPGTLLFPDSSPPGMEPSVEMEKCLMNCVENLTEEELTHIASALGSKPITHLDLTTLKFHYCFKTANCAFADPKIAERIKSAPGMDHIITLDLSQPGPGGMRRAAEMDTTANDTELPEEIDIAPPTEFTIGAEAEPVKPKHSNLVWKQDISPPYVWTLQEMDSHQ